MKSYHRTETKERIKIYELQLKGHGVSEIAKILGGNKTSISRKFGRNIGLGFYHPVEADEKTKAWRKSRR